MLASTGASGKNDLMKRFIDKSVDLDLLKELSKKHEETLVQKKQELSQEKKKLDKLHFELWTQNDKFCDTVWNFTRANNYPDYIKQQLDIPVDLPRKKQQNDQQMIENMQKEIKILTKDIKVLEDELSTRPKPSDPKTKKEASKFVYKTPINLKIKPNNNSSCFTVKKKSKICEKFEKL